MIFLVSALISEKLLVTFSIFSVSMRGSANFIPFHSKEHNIISGGMIMLKWPGGSLYLCSLERTLELMAMEGGQGREGGTFNGLVVTQ